ncbi:hypothetical protein BJV85_001543 [Clostridium acetobutylicum]|uniref:Predicted membrane protein n=1 Tax=Clostridium acetobutylicum (strain ATCC 824 / DSM 792 / JCM 1419 / IAM 19013 / LMG 5710 / NBRC 13948 / NRRL B-527 / VKM B-1787 / 2291 / W) TaxID=272562 RepID=Q97GM4_CLOAB|nr:MULTISPECIES: hypothetical protein [Clostridium]AAK80298.1 Predicted membrane protein [Clostridium acetobutylicum ATCC 824]ADZ21393.1 membrane protein [Clostridium acetobutylicum EA 2018]AEI32290.1 hypothetical protein SMB_G2376 [Clostridium acetobutylicum DSM 1731]AWV79281.1 hypothetical protein DK921_04050 [Clostridium acetobutylicum]KHD38477.1 membrane protein [Clostridium acetobutylicum]
MAISDTNGRTKKECIIANKVYDQCRQQDCIEKLAYDNATGQPINPPDDAAAVVIVPNSFSIGSIILVNKAENPFRRGYYDIELKFTFLYTLQFRNSVGTVIATVPASSIFNKKVTLFGSIGATVNIFTDLVNSSFSNLQAAPFVLVEANGYPLDATLSYTIPVVSSGEAAPVPNAVNVTIGLFTIIKLFRLVNLIVPSTGFCKPDVCEEISEDPCEYFNNLEFPFDIFDPPQKEDFALPEDENCSHQYLNEEIGELDKD